LLFSEYVEGSSFNKAIELHNGSAAAVVLDAYVLRVISNGSTTRDVALAGNLAGRGTYVVCHPQATAALLSRCDTTTATLNFNGNDTLQLLRAGALVDRVGDGTDPGTAWGTSVRTLDATLRRRCSIATGDTSTATGYDPALQWDALPMDDFSNVGQWHCSGVGSSSSSSQAGGTSSAANSSSGSGANSSGGSSSSLDLCAGVTCTVGCNPATGQCIGMGALAQLAYVKASNHTNRTVGTVRFDDAFGNAVALSADGNTLAVAAHAESSGATGINGNQNNTDAPTSGAVYVFVRNAGSWVQQAYLKASNTGAWDEFGFSLALSADGNTLAVGAAGEASGATGINGNQADDAWRGTGAVYVFTRSGSSWTQQAYVKPSDTGTAFMFGWSVALSAEGNTLAVGAIYAEAVYVFTRSAGTWSQQDRVVASNGSIGDHFGSAVALSADGNTLAVGAQDEESTATGINGNQADNSATYSGAAYVFTRSGSAWSQQAYLKASNTGAFDYFAATLALSADGNTLVVGSAYEDSNASGINGNALNESRADSGAAYVFIRAGTTWTQKAYVKPSNPGQGDEFGSFVALSADGNTLVVGASSEDSGAVGVNGGQADNSLPDSGAVYVFSRSGVTWTQRAYLKASNTDVSDWLGGCVAVSGDGHTLVAGAVGEDSNATGVNGNQTNELAEGAGAVYVFSL
jgi:hypothetical protein